MTITKQRVTCKCGHVFDAEIVAGPIIVALASMEAIRCPECGGGEFGLGGSYDDAPPLEASLEDRAAWWKMRGETGISSLTIWCALAGGRSDSYCYPCDPDDFRRCKLLLDLIPEWRPRLGEVTKRFPWFAPFERRWEEFEELYRVESPRQTCPALYNLMQTASAEADKIRWQ